MKCRLLIGWLLAFFAPDVLIGGDHAPKSPNKPSVALAFVNDDRPSFLEIDLAIGDASFEEVWHSTFDSLFQFADANANDELEDSEVALLPSPQALQLALGSGFAPPIGSVSPDDLRGHANGRITQRQMTEYYRRNAVGTVSVGIGQLKSEPVLTRALLAALDIDQDGSVSNAEWARAAETLVKLDTNDDELVGAGEIVPNTLYPGAAGTMLLKSTLDNNRQLKESSFAPVIFAPVVLLSTDPYDALWTNELHNQGLNVNADQLRRLRRENTAARWSIQLGVGDAPTGTFAWSSKKLRLQGWLVGGSLAEPNRRVRDHVITALESSFESDSAGHEPSADWLVPLADRDRDGQVSRAEAQQWCNIQTSIVHGQVLVTILWGGGLFEILDRNHDGGLSTRELRSAWQTLSEANCITEGRFDVGEVPQVNLVIASQGFPETITVVRPGRRNWARSMDRNADGDISRREFSGPAEAFRKMDLDRDGLVDAQEAALQLQPRQ